MLSQKEFYESKIEEYSNIITSDPNNAKNYHYRARAKIELRELSKGESHEYKVKSHEYKSAIEDLDKAIELEPRYYHQMWNYHLRARVYYERNDSEKALSDINKAVNIDPINYENYKLKKDIDRAIGL